jgi:cation transport regulator
MSGGAGRAILCADTRRGAAAPIMPYASNDDLPEPVRAHLPPHAQDIYRAAFNSAWQQYADSGRPIEEIAHRVAWAAVKKLYRKAGDYWVLR